MAHCISINTANIIYDRLSCFLVLLHCLPIVDQTVMYFSVIFLPILFYFGYFPFPAPVRILAGIAGSIVEITPSAVLLSRKKIKDRNALQFL